MNEFSVRLKDLSEQISRVLSKDQGESIEREITISHDSSVKVEAPPISPIPESKITEQVEVVLKEEKETEAEKEIKKPGKGLWERFKEKNPDLEKFIGENLLGKVAIGILVLGIGFFVKYAIDENWINQTARAGIGILCGGILIVLGHRTRIHFKAFSSILAAGGISIFYFTIALAFQEYHLFSQNIAFIIMIVITIFSILIGFSYDRIELAAISLTGGFAAPFMISTGEGNYQVLFSYLLILVVAMAWLAKKKSWNLIRILAFFYSVFVYGGWLMTKGLNIGHPEYRGALFFGTAFYLLFLAIHLFFILKRKREIKGLDVSLLLSTTLLYYAAGMSVFHCSHQEYKGVFTIIIAFLNLALSWFLFRKYKLDARLIYLFLGLTLTFITLAAPVQLQGNFITLFWSAEALLLFWLAYRSRIFGFRAVAVLLQLLTLISLFIDWYDVYSIDTLTMPKYFVSKGFITGMFSGLSFLGIFYLAKRDSQAIGIGKWTMQMTHYKATLKIAIVLLFYLTGYLETSFQAISYFPENTTGAALACAFHLLYTGFWIHVFALRKNRIAQLTAIFAGGFNILLYLCRICFFPFEEMRENFYSTGSCHVSFSIHYLSAALIILLLYDMRKLAFFAASPLFKIRNGFSWIGTFVVVYLVSSEVLLHGLFFFTNFPESNSQLYQLYSDIYHSAYLQIIKAGFPVAWGMIAFSLLSFGIRKHAKHPRIIALALLAITILKLFIYDIKDVNAGGKIIAFILLGILLLVMSFMYQKIRNLILEDENNSRLENAPTDENN